MENAITALQDLFAKKVGMVSAMLQTVEGLDSQEHAAASFQLKEAGWRCDFDGGCGEFSVWYIDMLEDDNRYRYQFTAIFDQSGKLTMIKDRNFNGLNLGAADRYKGQDKFVLIF